MHFLLTNDLSFFNTYLTTNFNVFKKKKEKINDYIAILRAEL